MKEMPNRIALMQRGWVEESEKALNKAEAICMLKVGYRRENRMCKERMTGRKRQSGR